MSSFTKISNAFLFTVVFTRWRNSSRGVVLQFAESQARACGIDKAERRTKENVNFGEKSRSVFISKFCSCLTLEAKVLSCEWCDISLAGSELWKDVGRIRNCVRVEF